MRHYKTWFHPNGEIIRNIPKQAARNCTHPGPCDRDVSDLRVESGFNIPPALRKQAEQYLSEYGAWNDAELKAMNPEQLEDTILWIACGDISEGQTFIGIIR